MKNILVLTLFMLASVAWAAAQQPGSAQDPSAGQATSPSSQSPSQTQPSAPGSGAQNPAGGQASNAPVTEGCLGGSEPHYTLTDKTGTTYKLNIPPKADTSKLASHVGEPVLVQGDVNNGKAGNASIDVQGIGRGMGKCPGSAQGNGQAPPK